MKTRRRSGELACLRGVRGRWTAEVAQQVLAAQEASGESLASFARRQGLAGAAAALVAKAAGRLGCEPGEQRARFARRVLEGLHVLNVAIASEGANEAAGRGCGVAPARASAQELRPDVERALRLIGGAAELRLHHDRRAVAFDAVPVRRPHGAHARVRDAAAGLAGLRQDLQPVAARAAAPRGVTLAA